MPARWYGQAGETSHTLLIMYSTQSWFLVRPSLVAGVHRPVEWSVISPPSPLLPPARGVLRRLRVLGLRRMVSQTLVSSPVGTTVTTPVNQREDLSSSWVASFWLCLLLAVSSVSSFGCIFFFGCIFCIFFFAASSVFFSGCIFLRQVSYKQHTNIVIQYFSLASSIKIFDINSQNVSARKPSSVVRWGVWPFKIK